MGRSSKEKRLLMRHNAAHAEFYRAADSGNPHRAREAARQANKTQHELTSFRWERTKRRAWAGNEEAIEALLQDSPEDPVYVDGLRIHPGRRGWAYFAGSLPDGLDRGNGRKGQ
jgi:hypothetical protein